MCVCAYVCASVRACVHVCMRVCVLICSCIARNQNQNLAFGRWLRWLVGWLRWLFVLHCAGLHVIMVLLEVTSSDGSLGLSEDHNPNLASSMLLFTGSSEVP